ncbi:MAG TPA: hypothetical protein DDX19_03620 [Rhodopirellula baltica]|uniref:Uncharacterized protein n=1 Tax=Rhodopirellula baltica (strain DSM 10527 / NCIMB 13988 / SH1) TaxID=243090 RepID=Q7UI42_RHOBA|nr:hypothetical protein-transmembrane prediction [Rhodopirellula baltica SH 1]HBE61859.1 hypothetical protein [Rhodopirellula baltica]
MAVFVALANSLALLLAKRRKDGLPLAASSAAVDFTQEAPCRAIGFWPERGGIVRIPATQRDFLCL